MFAQSNKAKFPTLFTARHRTLCLCSFTLAQILLVCGCNLVPKQRPPQIPAFVPGDEKLSSVPRIAGRYADKGEAFTKKGKSVGQVSLSGLLFGSDPAYAEADVVNIVESEPDTIVIQVLKKGQSVAQRRLSKYTGQWSWDSSKLGQPYCGHHGFLLVQISVKRYDGSLGPVSGGSEGVSCLLRKAVDGSLIVLQREAGTVFVIVPLIWSNNTWYRFPPIADGDQPATQPR